jgi:hypothetical protein
MKHLEREYEENKQTERVRKELEDREQTERLQEEKKRVENERGGTASEEAEGTHNDGGTVEGIKTQVEYDTATEEGKSCAEAPGTVDEGDQTMSHDVIAMLHSLRA